MKWTVVLLIFLGLLGLWRMGGVSGEKSKGGNELRLSERRVLDRSWRKLPEAEMTIEEMERYAAGLSDQELREEIEELIITWLEENSGLSRPQPPRLVVMLARELGKRDGLDTVDGVLDFLYELQDGFDESGESQQAEYAENLAWQLETAIFCGALVKQPQEVIEWYLAFFKGTVDQSVGGPSYNFHVVKQGEEIGKALQEIAGDEPELAFSLLLELQKFRRWQGKGMVVDFLAGVSKEQRGEWLKQAMNLWPREEHLFKVSLESPAEVKSYLIENKLSRHYGFHHVMKKLDTNTLVDISRDEDVSSGIRKDFTEYLFYQQLLPLGEIVQYPPEMQESVLSDWVFGIRNWDDWDHVGPLDGKEILREQDRKKRIPIFEKVLPLSDLSLEEKNELLGVLNEVKIEEGE